MLGPLLPIVSYLRRYVPLSPSQGKRQWTSHMWASRSESLKLIIIIFGDRASVALAGMQWYISGSLQP